MHVWDVTNTVIVILRNIPQDEVKCTKKSEASLIIPWIYYKVRSTIMVVGTVVSSLQPPVASLDTLELDGGNPPRTRLRILI